MLTRAPTPDTTRDATRASAERRKSEMIVEACVAVVHKVSGELQIYIDCEDQARRNARASIRRDVALARACRKLVKKAS